MVFQALVAASVPLPSQLAAPPFCSRRLPDSFGVCTSGCRYGKLKGARCSATSEKSGNRKSEDKVFWTSLPIRDFYELLGVPVEASPGEIRHAYRNLQKKHHPDIVGKEYCFMVSRRSDLKERRKPVLWGIRAMFRSWDLWVLTTTLPLGTLIGFSIPIWMNVNQFLKRGHAMTLLLNEAYQTLMDENLRSAYNAAHSYKQALTGRYKSFTGSPYSTWVGPDRPQGIFVDENVCVGCRECVYIASDTFTMDENTGCARVKAQWADSEPLVKMAREACPVNCIHLVEREDLASLEYLIRPQAKPSNGVYGGGWERPRNVFMAAATLKRQAEEKKARAASPLDEETPAQRSARMAADLRLRMGPLWKLWSWAGQPSAKESSNRGPNSGNDWPWKGLFGRSSTSELLILRISKENVSKTVAVVQDWASTFASGSELPLPMPFRTDILPNGVQLSLITASNGTISSVGSLVVTVEETSVSAENAALGDPFDAEEESQVKESYLRVRREGTTGIGALPGEGRIVKALRDVVLGRDAAYEAYRLPRL